MTFQEIEPLLKPLPPISGWPPWIRFAVFLAIKQFIMGSGCRNLIRPWSGKMGMHIEHDGLMSFGKNMCTQTHTHTQQNKRQHTSGFNHLVIWKMLGFFSSSFSWKIQHPWLLSSPISNGSQFMVTNLVESIAYSAFEKDWPSKSTPVAMAKSMVDSVEGVNAEMVFINRSMLVDLLFWNYQQQNSKAKSCIFGTFSARVDSFYYKKNTFGWLLRPRRVPDTKLPVAQLLMIQVQSLQSKPEEPMERLDSNPFGLVVFSSWWLNQPIWNICLSNWIMSPSRGQHKTIFETSNQFLFWGILTNQNQSD